MAARGDMIAQFIEITGTDDNTATFYLNSSEWDIEQALGNYWNTQSDMPPTPTTGHSNEPSPTTPVAPTSSSGAVAAAATKSTGADEGKKAPKAKPKFATLNDMSKEPSDDEEHQAFYAGGSDRSGQQVLGPPKRKNFREQLSDMMRSAQENAGDLGPSTSGGSSGGAGSGNVWGQGMRLGMTDSDHTAVGINRTAETSGNKPVVVLKLWSQGFSIDGGELRHYDDPENKEFLETVMRGEIPQELLEMGRMVNVDVEDHRHEDFKRQAAPQTFKGSGQKLGSPVANVVAAKAPAVAAAVPPAEAAQQEANARDAINLNSEAPSTTLQIRLADGSRLAAQFNLTHTVSDIRRFIQTARPQYSASNFTLVSSFPTRELSDDSSTIEKAGLKNAALMQRLK
ncbi:NSFL1 cofactor p47 [Drosophila guanche]|uniref:Blast:NSFL1 cofactor p47 n=1 Tax=Drosophila guanche TaxID=7266 RepID=A0A3B0JPX2_DROGU|nr:NSFL1 cofactor p47 [Drosophila guanche]XP_034120087.1 NSFL1 cofactor p47 [Drosophila guanche]SPP75699.1 blast:NSFL1 cofactor p47 [Drosophila guanche]